MDIPIKQTDDAKGRAAKVRLVVFDVDGVLTSGKIAIGKDGEVMKEFFVQDGLGIAVTQRAGIKTAIITGRESEMVRLRSAELKICDVYQGTLDKQTALRELMDKLCLWCSEFCGRGSAALPLCFRTQRRLWRGARYFRVYSAQPKPLGRDCSILFGWQRPAAYAPIVKNEKQW